MKGDTEHLLSQVKSHFSSTHLFCEHHQLDSAKTRTTQKRTCPPGVSAGRLAKASCNRIRVCFPPLPQSHAGRVGCLFHSHLGIGLLSRVPVTIQAPHFPPVQGRGEHKGRRVPPSPICRTRSQGHISLRWELVLNMERGAQTLPLTKVELAPPREQ